MKALMFGWEFPPYISGGLGTACYGLTQGLLQHGIEIIFVMPRAMGLQGYGGLKIVSADETEVSSYRDMPALWKDKFTHLAVDSSILPYLSPQAFEQLIQKDHPDNIGEKPATKRMAFSGLYGSSLMDEVKNYAFVAATLANQQPFDIIHAHDWHSFPAGILARAVSGKPLIVHVHATEFDRSGENINNDVFAIELEGMQQADTVIAVSEYTRQMIINKYGINPAKISVVHNGMDQLNAVSAPSARPFDESIVTYLGRVTYQKGPEYFIEAAVKVLKKSKDFRFVMAGSGDQLYRMILKAAGHRLTSHFHFTGFLKGDDVKQMLAMSDVYVMPSVSEPFGISPLEAANAKVPVIISKQSGVKEVLTSAIALDFWDTDAMANVIHALAKYKGLADLLVREGLRELGRLSWNTQALKVIQIYQSQINNS